MRKLFAMLTVVALATGMTACSDDDGTETPKDPTTTNFNLRARGGNVMVTLTTSDYRTCSATPCRPYPPPTRTGSA